MRILATLAAAASLAACTANDASIYRSVDFQNGTQRSALIGAKQRAIISVEKKVVIEPKSQRTERQQIVCAEPSPDALSAISTSFSSSLAVGIAGQGDGSGALGSALKEAASELGSRNATIQLLRDGYYRLCEGFLNGSIKRYEYQIMVNKLTNAMVALLSVEQLTPAQKVSTTIQGGDGVETTTEASRKPPETQPEPEKKEGDGQSSDAAAGTKEAASETDKKGKEDAKPTLTATATAKAGPPSVTVTMANASQDFSDHIAREVSAITSNFLYQSRFQDCLIALDKLTFDDDAMNSSAGKIIQAVCASVIAADLPDNKANEAAKAQILNSAPAAK